MSNGAAASISQRGRRSATYAMIGGLYFVQGMPLGFAFEAVPSLLRHAGTSLETLALAPLAALPWVLKFLWAPFVENHWSRSMGRRRSWIIPMQIGLAITLAILAFLPISNINALYIIALATAASFFAATQDIAVDALAAERLAAGDMGDANALQVGGLAAGMLVAGAGTMIAVDMVGQKITFGVLAICVLMALAPVILWQEPAPAVDTRRRAATVFGFFSRPHALAVFAF